MESAKLAEELTHLPGWRHAGNALHKTYEAPTFSVGMERVNAVAAIAEKMDHHPDIDIRYTKITFHLWTHTANGVTAKDFKLAAEIDRVWMAR